MAKIADAPNGENAAPVGTEKLPVSGSQWMALNTIKTWLESQGLSGASPFADYFNDGTWNTVTDGTDDAKLTIDTEEVDDGGIASLTADEITISAPNGYYDLNLVVDVYGVNPFNGYVKLSIFCHTGGAGEQEIYKNSWGYSTADGINEVLLHLGPLLKYMTTGAGRALYAKISNHLGESVDVGVIEYRITQL